MDEVGDVVSILKHCQSVFEILTKNENQHQYNDDSKASAKIYDEKADGNSEDDRKRFIYREFEGAYCSLLEICSQHLIKSKASHDLEFLQANKGLIDAVGNALKTPNVNVKIQSAAVNESPSV